MPEEMTNAECIERVQSNLVKMAKLANAEKEDNLYVEDIPVEIGPQTKTALKQAINALKVDCVTTLNKIKV